MSLLGVPDLANRNGWSGEDDLHRVRAPGLVSRPLEGAHPRQSAVPRYCQATAGVTAARGEEGQESTLLRPRRWNCGGELPRNRDAYESELVTPSELGEPNIESAPSLVTVRGLRMKNPETSSMVEFERGQD